MSFIEWMLLTYIVSITAVDAMNGNKNALYLRASISIVCMIGYGCYVLFNLG